MWLHEIHLYTYIVNPGSFFSISCISHFVYLQLETAVSRNSIIQSSFRFLKAKAADERATVITYAFFHAFKFPDALSVHIRCKVEICRHGCLDHCQLAGVTPQRHGALDRKDDRTHQDHNDIK